MSRNGHRRIGAAAALVVAAVLVVGSAAAHESDAPAAAEPTAQLSPTEGPPGTIVVVSGICGSTLALAFAFDTAVEFPVAADGSYAGSIVVPADVLPGPVSISTACLSGDALHDPFELTFAVTDDTAVPTPEPAAVATASTSIGPPGTTIDVSGQCRWDLEEPGESAVIELQAGPNQGNISPVAVATATADPAPDGSFSTALVVPAGLDPGVYGLSVRCVVRGAFASALRIDFTVTAANGPGTPPGNGGGTTLPATA